jgi:RsiW-degrading membrane proteinase PrsW (M82 family)
VRQVIIVGAIIAGLLAAVTGLLSAAGVLLLAILGGDASGNGLLLGTLGLGAGGFGLALGLLLAWEGWQAYRGRPAGRPRLPAWGWWLLALVLVLLAGQAVASKVGGLLLPLFHIAAAVIPALLFLALALGGTRPNGTAISDRAVVSAIAWGSLGSVGLALLLEGIVIVVVLLVLPPLIDIVAPGTLAHLQALLSEVQQGREPDLRLLQPLLRSPWVLIGGVLIMSVLVPLIEEAAKGLAVPLLALTGRQLTRLDAFLVGVAAGAGFAMVEGVTNGALALSQPSSWTTAMAARGAAAALHCVVTGLTGLGWHAIIVERNWLRGLGLGLAAVVFHGLWNLSAVGSAWLSLQHSGAGVPSLAGNLLTGPVVGLMGVLFLVALIVLRWLPARLQAHHQIAAATVVPPETVEEQPS